MVFFAKFALQYAVQNAGVVIPEIDCNYAVFKLDELDRPDSRTRQELDRMRNLEALNDFGEIHGV